MTKNSRIEARLPEDLKALLARAAALQGRSLSDFVIASAAEAALRVIQDVEVITLSARDQLTLAQELMDPTPPNEALKRAAERYWDLDDL